MVLGQLSDASWQLTRRCFMAHWPSRLAAPNLNPRCQVLIHKGGILDQAHQRHAARGQTFGLKEECDAQNGAITFLCSRQLATTPSNRPHLPLVPLCMNHLTSAYLAHTQSTRGEAWQCRFGPVQFCLGATDIPSVPPTRAASPAQ